MVAATILPLRLARICDGLDTLNMHTRAPSTLGGAALLSQGALDAILCQESGVQDAEAAMQVVWNNLKGPGTYVLFTHGPPSLRMAMLSKLQWASVTIKALMPVGTALAAPAQQQRSKTTDGLEIVDAAVEAEFAGSVTYVYICKKPYQCEYARVQNTSGMLMLEASRLPPVDSAISSHQFAASLLGRPKKLR